MSEPDYYEPNYFGELISILHVEELLRLQRRCKMLTKHRMAEILGDEIEEREAIERADGKE